MTKDELQKILSSENKFKVEQIRQFIYEMREDIYDGLCTHLIEEGFVGKYIEQFCLGKMEAFQLCLDLLDKVESEVENG